MKNFVLLFLLLVTSFAQAANISDNNLNLGNGTTTGNKKITFDTGAGTSNKKLEVDSSTGAMSANTNTLTLGDGASTTKKIIFDTGDGSANAFIGWDSTLEAPVFSKDGVLAKKLGSGGGGGAAGITFNENGGFEDGINSKHSYTVGVATELGTSDALVEEKSVRLDFTAENDYYRSDYFVLPKGLYGSACELRFKYVGGDANTYVRVETEVGTVLGRYQRPSAGSIVYGLQTLASPGYESVFFKCPTAADIVLDADHANIRYVFYQGTASNAASLDVDAITQGELIGLVESTTPDIFSAKISSTDVVSDENVDWIEGNCTDASTGAVTCVFKAGIFTVAPNCVGTTVVGASSILISPQASATSVTFFAQTAAGANVNSALNISCQKQGADAKQSVQVYKSIPKIAKNVNEFSVRVSAAGTVSDETPSGWINGNASLSDTSLYAISFDSGIFQDNPHCWGVPDITTAGDVVAATASSTSAITVRTSNGATKTARAFTFFCKKSNNDFTMPTVQPMVIGQVTNSAAESGLVNVRTEICMANNSGSASINVDSGLCEGWIQSVTKSGTGIIDWVFKTGTFSAKPVCVFNHAQVEGFFPSVGPSLTGVQTNTRNGSSTPADSNVWLSCQGKR